MYICISVNEYLSFCKSVMCNKLIGIANPVSNISKWKKITCVACICVNAYKIVTNYDCN